jgi:hypothetical protein
MDKDADVTNNRLKVGKLSLSHVVLILGFCTRVESGHLSLLEVQFSYLGGFVVCVIKFNFWLWNMASIPNIRDCSRAEQSVCFWVSQEKCFTFFVLIASLLLLLTTCVAFFNVGCPYEYDWVLMKHQLDVMLIGEIAFSYSLKSLSQKYQQWCSPSSLITWWQKGQ